VNKITGCDVKISSEKKPVSIFRKEERPAFSRERERERERERVREREDFGWRPGQAPISSVKLHSLLIADHSYGVSRNPSFERKRRKISGID